MNGRMSIIFSEGLRPFFLTASLEAIFLLLLWSGSLSGILALPGNNPLAVWHLAELLFGFFGSAIAGFVLTAVPSFTSTALVKDKPLLNVMKLWLSARLLLLLSGLLGVLPWLVMNLVFFAAVLRHTLPQLWQDPFRRHRSFFWVLSLSFLLQIWASWQIYFATPMALASLNLLTATYLMLVLLALARISMEVVNGYLKDIAPEKEFLARPPRRNLLLFSLGLYFSLEYFFPHNTINGWVALAVAASALNILNDWHLGRVLFKTHVLAMYLLYWMMALGFLMLGLDTFMPQIYLAGGKHLLTIGVLGLAVMAVMNIAGSRHTGRPLVDNIWVKTGYSLIIVAALLRALVPAFWPQHTALLAYYIPALCWVAGFGCYFKEFWFFLTSEKGAEKNAHLLSEKPTLTEGT